MTEIILKYWLELVLTGISGLVLTQAQRTYKRVIREITEQKQIKDVLLAIMHDRVYQECKRLLMRGHITVKELDNLEYLYRAYTSLGGNGTCAKLYERCCSLKYTDDAWSSNDATH